MSNGNIPKERALPKVVGASDEAAVSKNSKITAGGSRSLRVDVGVGKVVSTTGVSAKLQDSSLSGIWNDVKTETIAASTASDLSISAIDTNTNKLTSTGHGLVDGQPVGVTAASMPGGLYSDRLYFVKNATTNDFELVESSSSASVDITSAGTTVVVTPVTQTSITVQQDVAADKGRTPLRAVSRVLVSTGAGDSCQVLSVIITQED